MCYYLFDLKMLNMRPSWFGIFLYCKQYYTIALSYLLQRCEFAWCILNRRSIGYGNSVLPSKYFSCVGYDMAHV